MGVIGRLLSFWGGGWGGERESKRESGEEVDKAQKRRRPCEGELLMYEI